MQREAVVNKAILAVYDERDIRLFRTDELLYGTVVYIEYSGFKDRYRMESKYQYTGLVSAGGLVVEENLVNEWNKGKKLLVTRNFCDILSMPTVRSRVLLQVFRGSYLLDGGRAAEPGYRSVRMADGTEGFVREEHIETRINPSLLIENELRDRLVKTAASYYGSPYRWGGKTPCGIDCSGLTFMTYAMQEILIHRDSAWISGTPVEKIADCERKPGDLLYFPGHIALYIGNGEYIHSTARDGLGVTVNSLVPGTKMFREDLYQSCLYTGSIFKAPETNTSILH